MIAASIASAGTLCIEPEAKAVRASIRSGAIDFTVNNLDEALRALKNEIRKGLSIAVCLEADPQQILLEMKERGVQPDILCLPPESNPAMETFLQRGAFAVTMQYRPSPHGQPFATWRVSELPGKWLPRIDEVIATILPSADTLRRQWLLRAPRYLGRALRAEHTIPLTQDEFDGATDTLKKLMHTESWPVQLTLDYTNSRNILRS